MFGIILVVTNRKEAGSSTTDSPTSTKQTLSVHGHYTPGWALSARRSVYFYA